MKLTLATFGSCWSAARSAYFVIEFDNPATMAAMDPGQRVLQSFFLSTMARSGGFSTFDTGQLDGASLLVTDMLMFIGGGSASTAGGIKVTTLAILFLAAFAEARGIDDMEPSGAASRRTCCGSRSASCSGAPPSSPAATHPDLLIITGDAWTDVLFDVISAFATCGLSTGFTAERPDAAQYVLAATMFMGRIGTVTLAAALAASARRRSCSTDPKRGRSLADKNATAGDAPVLVIGLGRFGAATAGQLTRLNRDVLVVDEDMALVQKWADTGHARRAGGCPVDRCAPPDRRAGLRDRGRRGRLVDRGERADHGEPGRPRHPADLGEGDQPRRTARSCRASAPTT